LAGDNGDGHKAAIWVTRSLRHRVTFFISWRYVFPEMAEIEKMMMLK